MSTGDNAAQGCMHPAELWVVVPAYNEQAAITEVLVDWAGTLRKAGVPAVIAVIDDGSQDGTRAAVRSLFPRFPEIRLFPQANAGHGRACLRGYRLALDGGAEWVLQIDSDGQCDPAGFEMFWARREGSAAVYGRRTSRDDGRLRPWISSALGILVWACSGIRVPDPNVPYRLMNRESLRAAVSRVPDDVDLANVYLAVLQQQRGDIRWIDIGFRERSAGRTHYRAGSMAAKALNVSVALLRDRRTIRNQPAFPTRSIGQPR
jgi:glycosyltransferase involved in cell wall biosynthesis